tara:strand:- start:14 stop:328 length:315 start_codon:yes stop_codon:yes gene_type:complete
MQNIDGKFWKNKQQIEKLVERLQTVLEECELPDDLNNPESEEDEIKVNWFSNKIEQLACELGELGEEMGVGLAVAENLQDKREEESLDRGDHLYKQPEGYKVGQ